MSKFFIVHYLPIEHFPPAFNMLQSLSRVCKVRCVSSEVNGNNLSELRSFVSYPIKHTNKKVSSVVRLIQYLWFTICTLFQLIAFRPNRIIYYESISALPVYLYKRFLNRKVEIFIHYHEYMTPKEYAQVGMRLASFNNRLEVNYLYKNATWMSHTNQYRLDFFQNDFSNIDKTRCNILPNYPPKSWFVQEKSHNNDCYRLVYIGSLSNKTMYLEELCQWIVKQGGTTTIDFYSFNFHSDVISLIESFKSPYITLHPQGIEYNKIPTLLSKYDVGIIFYKALNINTVFCETNKFYEYLICGLDVWFSSNMTMLDLLDKSKFASNIVKVNYENMDTFIPPILSSVVDNRSYDLFADNEYTNFYNSIVDGKY